MSLDLVKPILSAHKGVDSLLKALSMHFTTTNPSLASLSMGRLGMTRYNYKAASGDAKGNAIIMACVLWLARAFPEAPVQVMRNEGQGQWRIRYDHKMSQLIARPNPFYNGVLLQMATVVDFFMFGNAYWIKIRSRSGEVVELWWVPQHMIEPQWPQTGNEYISHYDYDWGGGKDKIPPRDIVHFRYGLDPDNERKGLSPLGALFREIFTDNEAANYTASIVRNLGVPGIVIIPGEDVEVDEETADALKASWRTRLTNDNRGEPIVLSANVKVEKLSFSPKDLTLKDLRRIPEERASAIFGTPAMVVGLGAGLDRSTFTNYGEAREAAYEGTVIPVQRLMAADLDVQLLPDFVAESRLPNHKTSFDLGQVRILQEDKFKAYQRTNIAVNGGWLMVSEGREAVGLPWEDEHKYYLRRKGLVPVTEENQQFPDGQDPALAPDPALEPGLPGSTTSPTPASGGGPTNPNQPQGGRVPAGTTSEDDTTPRRNGRTREPVA